ncbi:DNA polymerase Y family protein [Georgenia sp. TF02-10]|uniref:Y-family DNA polymerase n=1 Tax=Georgenia sp. TF02-10 TaxID=2917725 RepID=UPI001FA7824E|nr:DNA polymerase Y family protein [Georgenia sp. TF02-10]UNX56097.1 DNA polymerase Y family protein [Georgenia sp. TF02-10]
MAVSHAAPTAAGAPATTVAPTAAGAPAPPGTPPLSPSGPPAQALRRAVVWVPDWPVAAAVAEGAVPPDAPVAVHDGRGVVVTSAAARAAGVRRGMRRRTAQQLCPELALLGVDEVRDARAFEPLVQVVETVVAGVEVVRPGLVVMAARGPTRHLGSEEALAETLVGVLAEEAGAECQVGIGDGMLTAVLAARRGVVVPPGQAAAVAFLAPQDVGMVGHAVADRGSRAEVAELVDLLRRLGLRTLGALASLAPGDVAARFGGLGLTAQRLARGLDGRPVVARRPEQDVVAAADLDPPADRADVAAFAARGLAEQLAERMLRRGVVCGRLQVEARTEDGTTLTRTWALDGAPTARELTDRVRWQLEGWLAGRSGRPPAAPLVHLALTAQEVSPAGAVQDGLWGRARRGQAQADRAALRVQGLLGPDGVLAPVLQGGRDPRSTTRLVVWGDEAAPLRRTDAPWPGQLPSPSPATVPAEPVPVEVADDGGAPVRVDARGLASAAPARVRLPAAEPGTTACWPAGERTVTGWAGPWPVTERWWASDRRRRAYLQVSLADAPALLLVLEEGSWWVEGVYD